MFTGSEIEKEIRQRAEVRRQELMDALGKGILGQHNNPLADDKVNFQKGLIGPVSWAEMRRRSAGGKENQSPTRTFSDLLYPARPARSVYNSPLIKTTRPPLWKSPPPCENNLSSLGQCSSNGKSFAGRRDEGKVKSHVFQKSLDHLLLKPPFSTAPTAPLLSDFEIKNPLSTFKDQRLYPSLPRSDANIVLESPRKEKDLKEHCNHNAATATRKSGQHTFIQPTRSNLQKLNLSLTSIDTQSEDVNSPNDNSENDIEDTYDMDKFLEAALGSVINLNSTMADHSTEDSFHSAECCRIPDQIQTTSTIGSSMHLRKPSPQGNPQNDKVSHLLREAETHQQVMAQASKALTVCRSSKAFFNSESLVDAERLLLLASLRHKAVLDDIRGLLPDSESSADFKGQLCVSEISVPLKEDSLKWGKAEHDKDLWFLCVLCYGQQVLASDVVAYEPGAKCINFSGKLELLNLPASFLASLQIYTLRTYRPEQSNNGSKLSKAYRLFRRRSKLCFDSSGSSEQLLLLRTPAFALSGSVLIDVSRVGDSQPQNLLLEKVPLMSPLRGSASVRLAASLTSTMQFSGFLTILEKVGGSHAWQRRWCHLSELCMHFWNYPADQDEKVPLDVIDLRGCSSEQVELAPRYLCARSRTLMLEATRIYTPYDMNSTLMECNGNVTVVRYLFSCDSAKELKEWTSVLNQVLSSIKAWNIKECNYH